jgi:hypothetical protein
VEGVGLKDESAFDICATDADFLDRHGLKDHHFAAQLAEDLNPLGVAFLNVRVAHPAGTIAYGGAGLSS